MQDSAESLISFFYHLDISIEVAVYVDFDADTKIDVGVGVDDDGEAEQGGESTVVKGWGAQLPPQP